MKGRRRALAAAALLLGLVLTEPAAGAPRSAWQIGLVTPRYLTVGGSSAPLAAQVRDADGQPAPDGTRVTFLASLGLSLDPVVAETQDGLALTRMRSGEEAGFARLDAVVDGERAYSLLWIRPGPAAGLSRLEAEPERLQPGGSARITGYVIDRFGNPAEGDLAEWSAAGGVLVEAGARVDRGLVQATFVAGPEPGRAGVRVALGEAAGRVALRVDEPAPQRSPQPVWLPLALAAPAAVGGCTERLVNGGFEIAGAADGLPAGWQPTAGSGPWPRRVADAAEGDWALRLEGEGAQTPIGLRQSLDVPPGAQSGTLWLWARGAPVGGGLRLALWSAVRVGDRATPAPILLRYLYLAEGNWERLAFPLPAPPAGETRLELAPWAEDASAPLAEVDGLALRVCW